MKKEIAIYGAGIWGRKLCRILVEQDIQVKFFIDKKGEEIKEVFVNSISYPVHTLEWCVNHDPKIGVIIGVADSLSRVEILDQLKKLSFMILEVTDLIALNDDDRRTASRRFIKEIHESQMEEYYSSAEKTVGEFWDNDTVFRQLFNRMDITNVVELACGRGRHVPQYIELAKTVTLVDVVQKNIEYCKSRFKRYNSIIYVVNDGHSLKDIDDNSQTAVFSYDAMVHFEMLDVFDYLKESARILKKGGYCLFHHSNNTDDPKVSMETGKRGRNYMSSGLFAHLCDRAGLVVMEQHIIGEGYDCVTLAKKE